MTFNHSLTSSRKKLKLTQPQPIVGCLLVGCVLCRYLLMEV